MSIINGSNWCRLLPSIVFTFVLAACGGGGGSAGTPISGPGSAGAPVNMGTVAISLANSSGSATNTVSASGTTASATVLDSSGAVVPNRLVTFTGDAALVKFTPASGQILTNAAGVASIQLAAASAAAAGAGTITATAAVSGKPITGSVDFGVSAANVQLQAFNIGTTPIPAYGNRQISVKLVSGNLPVTTPVQITFSASCGTVSPVSVSTDASGTASTTYTADSAACAGTNVTLGASAAGITGVSSQIPVTASLATNIQFVSTVPNLIYLTGSTGSTQAILTFKVVDALGNPLQNQAVQLSLSNSATGASLNGMGNTNPVILTTNAAGLVSVSVFSGSIPTSVQVLASLQSNPGVVTASNTLTIASGRAVESSMSVALGKLAIEGANIDGTTTTVTVSVADRQGNPVPDGTEINLTSQTGVLIPSTCFTQGGTSQCSVMIRSQGTRTTTGQVAIFATLPGEEDFVDAAGSNVYVPGDSFTDLGNAYRDDNQNGVYDPGEFVIPRAGMTTCPGGVNGRANTCDGVWGAVDVRRQAIVVFSTSAAVITFAQSGGALLAHIADGNGNSVATGSTIAVAVASSNKTTTCTASTVVTAVPNTLAPITIPIITQACYAGDIVQVTVTSPGGLATTASYGGFPAAPPPPAPTAPTPPAPTVPATT
jgi:hypothetical protein